MFKNIIFLDNQSLLLTQTNELPENIVITEETIFLEKIGNTEYLCGSISTIKIKGFNAVPLRQALKFFGKRIATLIIKASVVINWYNHHRFCGNCGKPTIHLKKTASYEKICNFCNISFFPRISPSVMVLIYKDDSLIMARSPHFLPGVYSLIAGFVEPGETVEEAAHREVKEEIGINIKNLVYFGSQAWPFPDSLVIAFYAEYDSGDLVIDNNEIEAAAWYKYDNLPGRPSNPISIAQALIDDFISSRAKI